jgi:hypothetical protein
MRNARTTSFKWREASHQDTAKTEHARPTVTLVDAHRDPGEGAGGKQRRLWQIAGGLPGDAPHQVRLIAPILQRYRIRVAFVHDVLDDDLLGQLGQAGPRHVAFLAYQ